MPPAAHDGTDATRRATHPRSSTHARRRGGETATDRKDGAPGPAVSRPAARHLCETGRGYQMVFPPGGRAWQRRSRQTNGQGSRTPTSRAPAQHHASTHGSTRPHATPPSDGRRRAGPEGSDTQRGAVPDRRARAEERTRTRTQLDGTVWRSTVARPAQAPAKLPLSEEKVLQRATGQPPGAHAEIPPSQVSKTP